MKKVISILIIIAWAFPGLALGAGNEQAQILEGAKKEGRLIYYTSMTVNDSDLLVKKFTEKYPFLKVELYRSSGDNLPNRILAEGRAKRFIQDVTSSALNHTAIIQKEGYLTPYQSPEFAAYPANLRDPQGFWTSLYLMTHVLAYNTRMVSPQEAPKTYTDLLAPKWKGKISLDMLDAEWFGGQLDIMGQAKGLEFMKKLAAQNPIYRSGHNLQTQLLVSGEFPVAVNIYGHAAETFKAKGATIEWVPVEPVVISMHALSVSSHAPHPNAARLFVDFALSKEAQMQIRGFHRISARTDVEPDPPRLFRGFKIHPFWSLSGGAYYRV